MEDQESTGLPAIHKQMSLKEISEVLVATDLGGLSLTESEGKLLSEIIVSKVDGCALFSDAVEHEIERHKEYIKRHQAHIKTLTNQLSRFKDYVTYCLQKAGFPDGKAGDEFEIKLRQSPGSVETLVDPSENDLEMYGPNFVRKEISYAWNKSEISKAIKSGTCPIPETKVSLIKSINPQFKVRKGIK